MNKKILGVLLAAIVLLVMMTTGAMAENGSTHSHCVCGATHRDVGTHTTEETLTWTEISSADGYQRTEKKSE